jgi:predicted nucleic acid-binding Zn ribbon protein
MSATMTESRQCIVCGNPFEQRHRLAHTCSDECAEENRRQRKNERNRNARARRRAEAPPLLCMDCGQPYERIPSSNTKRCLPCRDANSKRQSYELVDASKPGRIATAGQGKIPKYFTDAEEGEYALATWLARMATEIADKGKPRFLTPEEIAERRAYRYSKHGEDDDAILG